MGFTGGMINYIAQLFIPRFSNPSCGKVSAAVYVIFKLLTDRTVESGNVGIIIILQLTVKPRHRLMNIFILLFPFVKGGFG